MTDENLIIVARIKAKESKVDFVKAELIKLIDITRSEEGCVSYDLHQDNDNPNLFLFFEKWDNYDIWQKHINNTHSIAFKKATVNAVEEVIVQQMTHIN